jgi:hypothetical protein
VERTPWNSATSADEPAEATEEQNHKTATAGE